ncbi:MAG: TonB-dependent receptor family protein [Salinibacter sp.]
MLHRHTLFAALLLLGALPAAAQSPDTTATDSVDVRLPGITIEAARAAETEASAPFAVTIQRRTSEEVALTPGTSLDNILRPLSGIWVNDRHHFALGERISVRGAGYRSNFGVRGIQILYDGLPLTLPDGQAFTDVVDPAVIRRVELIRSPASVFWGNGSGGVLFLSSRPTAATPSFRARVQGGSFGQWQGLLEGTGTSGAWRYRGYASGVRQDGFRAHSEGYRLRAGATLSRAFGSSTSLRLVARGDAQDTENPSSLTLQQFRADPSQARPSFEQFNSGKTSEQGQLGVTLDHDLGGATVSATAHYLYRSLDNPLPFGYIAYTRNSGGARVTLRRTTGRFEGGVGVDVGAQFDDRIEFTVTDNGRPGNSITLNQLETILSGSAFGYVRFNATDRVAITGGLRADGLQFGADDQLISDGNDSGNRTFSAWSPTVGLSYDVGPALLFAHYSTAFETPTASELSNRRDQQGGFNQTIEPQRTEGVEIGARGGIPAADLRFDLALYQQRIENLISSQRRPSGYQFYTNLGENEHRGLEASLTWTPVPAVELATRYTGTQFTIEAPEALEGNQVPGIPPHRGYVHLQLEQNGFWGRLSAEAVPDYYVNNTNTAEAPGYTLLDLRVGHKGLPWQDLTFKPFLTVDNLLDERYAASVVVNGGGEFYEPGPGRSFTLGLNVSL